MQFEKGHIYHIYNQGNNGQKIFFSRENYLFFLQKMRIYILPYADILSWCLMPNHFHFMVLVKIMRICLLIARDVVAQSEALADINSRRRTFNSSIGIMLRSYTNAINKQQQRTGALFRKKTKAESVTCSDGITPSFYNTTAGTQINIIDSEKQYPEMCFHYIHQNPVKAGLAKNAGDWEFSSARDYMNVRNGKLVNKEVAGQYIINIKLD